MVLQTSSCVSLDSLRISIYFQTTNQRILVRKLSKTKQADALMETAIHITENQEISLYVAGEKELNIDLPGVKNEIHIEANSNNTYILYTYNSNQQFPWTPGFLIYSVKVDDDCYYGLIRIEPKNISDSEFSIMHQYLEDRLKGITKNFASERKQWNQSPADDYSTRDRELVNWFLAHSKRLIHSLHLIEKNYISTYETVYVMEHVPKHRDMRSRRLESSPRGAKFTHTKFFNRKRVHSYDSSENRYVKYCTFIMLRELGKEKQNLEEEIKLADGEITSLCQGMDTLNMNQRIHFAKKKELERWRKQKERLYELQKGIESSMNYMNHLMHNPFWSQIKETLSKRSISITDRNYVLFNRLWRKFNLLQKRSGDKYHDYILHPTSKLYEYYTYFKFIDILLSVNFRIEELDSHLHRSPSSDIQPMSNVVLSKENIKIVVTYDEEVTYGSSEAIQRETYFFSRAPKRRPDIRVDLYRYDPNFEDYLYQSSIILEIKYRPLYNFYSETIFTPEMEQLNQYQMIKYYCPIRKEYFNGVKDVICVHPNIQDNYYFHTEVGIFVTLRPKTENRFESYIKERLEGWLQINAH